MKNPRILNQKKKRQQPRLRKQHRGKLRPQTEQHDNLDFGDVRDLDHASDPVVDHRRGQAEGGRTEEEAGGHPRVRGAGAAVERAVARAGRHRQPQGGRHLLGRGLGQRQRGPVQGQADRREDAGVVVLQAGERRQAGDQGGGACAAEKRR
ncbi:unnamed protein product [Callosobruchus maculatus]|uniref:Uncharacterized protein n=1 Tax=Callosobruchus maculatus TaxID=64391 RepID=A0A653D2H1_CALMS|nr:unnamed protein product [Callosobruchus maculatus]